MKWISVNDSLPELFLFHEDKHQQCFSAEEDTLIISQDETLLVGKYHKAIFKSNNEIREWFEPTIDACCCFRHFPEFKDITHWMPITLPENT